MARYLKIISKAHDLMPAADDTPELRAIENNPEAEKLLLTQITQMVEAALLLQKFLEKYDRTESKFATIIRESLLNTIIQEAQLCIALLADAGRYYAVAKRLDLTAKYMIMALQIGEHHGVAQTEIYKSIQEQIKSMFLTKDIIRNWYSVVNYDKLTSNGTEKDSQQIAESIRQAYDTLVEAGYLELNPID